jgi:hypothetical protein
LRPGQPLHPAFPPFWSTEFGSDGIDRDAFWAWQTESQPRMDVPLEEEPERVCLPSLIPAWKSGLATIVTLPYSGYFARQISRTHLVVSNETRVDAVSYAKALTMFALL